MKVNYNNTVVEIKPFPGNQWFVSYAGQEAWFKIEGKKWVKVVGGMPDKTLQAIKKAASKDHS
jgi:hypothetical protein